MEEKKFLTKQLPNILTMLNLVAGSVAVIKALEGQLITSALLILVGALLDFADGMAARLLNAGSELGKQLDSLSDLVSFCVAPAMIMFVLMSRSVTTPGNVITELPGSFLQLPLSSLLLILAGAYRLARFNIISSPGSFSGLAVPAAAIFICGLALIPEYPGYPSLAGILQGHWFYLSVIIILSLLMISKLPMLSLKFTTFSFRFNQARYLFLACSVILLIILQQAALPFIIVTYLLFSLINNLLVKKETRP
jgi:CDP-diacylglycerol--serine O-phosphatidyltransferase